VFNISLAVLSTVEVRYGKTNCAKLRECRGFEGCRWDFFL